jgi:hypothetical protein
MDFWATVVVLFRRWSVTVPAFMLAVGAAAAIYASIPTTYVSNAALVLTIPTSGGEEISKASLRPGLINPLLNFDNGLNMSAVIVVTALETPEEAAKLGVTPTGDPIITVNNGNSNPEALTESPFVFISGESKSPELAQQVVVRTVAEANVVLAEHQKQVNAPLATYITMHEVVPPTAPIPQHGRKLRAAAVALCIGLVASLCSAFAAESIGQTRRRRATGDTATPEELALDDRQPVRAGP